LKDRQGHHDSAYRYHHEATGKELKASERSKESLKLTEIEKQLGKN